MTVVHLFSRETYPDLGGHQARSMTLGLRAKWAGQFLWACDYLQSPFRAETHGWRVTIERIKEPDHRAMIRADLGLDP